VHENDDKAILEASRMLITYTLGITEQLEAGKISPLDYAKKRASLVGKPNLVQSLLLPISNVTSAGENQEQTAPPSFLLSLALTAIPFLFIVALVLKSIRPGLSILNASTLWFMASVLGAELLILIIEIWKRRKG
jgi:hypothetical protein